MFVRVATFENVDIPRMESLAAERRGAMPPGVRKVMVLVDREARASRFLTFFDSREAIAAAEATFESMGDEIPEEVRGRRVKVAVWEVAMDEAV